MYWLALLAVTGMGLHVPGGFAVRLSALSFFILHFWAAICVLVVSCLRCLLGSDALLLIGRQIVVAAL